MAGLKEASYSRWRLILGRSADEKMKSILGGLPLDERQSAIDGALEAVYGEAYPGAVQVDGQRSFPNLAKWLIDVRGMFPTDIVSVIQRDAIERKGLTRLIFEPETLKNIQPDLSMVSLLLALKDQIPEGSRRFAREAVKTVVEEILARMEPDLYRSVMGALNRRSHSPLPSASAVDWKRTIAGNLKNYDPARKMIVPEKFWFFERERRAGDWTVIVDIDQSGSMAESIIYASVMSSVFAGIPALDTHVVAFSDEVADLTEECREDPVEMLFGMQMGGGTDIAKSVEYCMGFITEPGKTLFILISDLHEGGSEPELLRRLEEISVSGCKVMVLLALTDGGTPSYNEALVKKVSSIGIPCAACSPDNLPNLIEGAINGADLADHVRSLRSGT